MLLFELHVALERALRVLDIAQASFGAVANMYLGRLALQVSATEAETEKETERERKRTDRDRRRRRQREEEIGIERNKRGSERYICMRCSDIDGDRQRQSGDTVAGTLLTL